MIQGLYAAATGMMSVEDRQAVIANNIANASTAGFKRHVAVQKGFYQAFETELRHPAWFNADRAPGGGTKVIETYADFSNGVLRTTGNPLDVAIVGPGFLSVNTPNGERYTRNGQFSLGQNGELLVGDGYQVLGAGGGPIVVNGASVGIAGDGTVMVDGAPVGQVQLTEFENPQFLVREGATLFGVTEQADPEARPAEATNLVGGAIETANVQIPNEVSEMLLALRAYAANQRVITAIDETASRLIDQVGAPS
jgi:flagellar basal-body rod protein FlgG